jgi:hypothetical protein
VSAVVVFKGEDGKLQGFGQRGEKAFAKFRRRVDGMLPGETVHFEWFEPRSPKHHGLFFAKLGALADRQEQFEEEDELRKWLTVGAGYCKFVPGPNGRMVALPQSIAWHKLDEADFCDLHAKVDAFLWTEHARGFLWGHLSKQQTYDLVDQFLAEFNK